MLSFRCKSTNFRSVQVLTVQVLTEKSAGGKMLKSTFSGMRRTEIAQTDVPKSSEAALDRHRRPFTGPYEGSRIHMRPYGSMIRGTKVD